MSKENKSAEKTRLHTRNKNRERYDLDALMNSFPELKTFIKPNKYGDISVDFANSKAVKVLNRALLKYYYGISEWDFPDENLCPPIPGRADYLHHIADLLCEKNFGKIPVGKNIIGYDIGTGASCIYPILGVVEYDWNFIASDIDQKSIESSNKIVESNKELKGKIETRFQKEVSDTFYGIIDKSEKIDFSMCNPPFHSSKEEAKKGNHRKNKNLDIKSNTLNFSGIHNELIYDGGESKFIHNMIKESRKFAHNCFWFSTLVSKQSNLKGIYKALEKTQATDFKTIAMGTGNKSTRIVAWTYLTAEEQKEWKEERWREKMA